MKNLFALIFWLLIVCFSLLLTTHFAYATHNRAGEITYRTAPLEGQPYRYEFTVVTYTKTGGTSENADRDSLEVSFGDGAFEMAPRVNGPIINGNHKGERIEDSNIKKNIYEIAHTYPGPFNYKVSMQDPNRIDDIVNIAFGESVNTPFYLESNITYADPQFFGFNTSPILLKPPIEDANVGERFVHNPNAFDADGDSLYFELTVPKASITEDVPLYQFPDEKIPGPENQITLNPFTGEFVWDAPQSLPNSNAPYIYNVAFLIREFRNGIEIGNMVRDMQIIVYETENKAPEIEAIRDTCVIIGDTFVLEIEANDPDENQTLTLSASGGPFETESSPAEFISTPSPSPATGTLTWETNCDHIYSEEYTIVIKAEDNFDQTNQGGALADLETWQLTLVPPPPSELQAEIEENAIVLTWNSTTPYICQSSPKFRGFSVWRSTGCDSLPLDTCRTGLAGTSYRKLADRLTETTYTDETAVKGPTYSYRIVAEFADAFTTSNPPTPLNEISSLASVNACISMPTDAPLMTNVSIEATQTSNGEIYVAWTKPNPDVLDTIVNPPPYRYELYRSEGFTGASELLNTWTYDAFYLANDTTYTDNEGILNTQNNAYNYKVQLFSNNAYVDESATASSVFLSISPGDNQLQLSWQHELSWLNYEYHIYRENATQGFDSIGTTDARTYVDRNLQNGQSYCYQIKALGTYDNPDLPSPLINFSQTACASPIDTIPPCPPVLEVTNACNSELGGDSDELVNFLTWESSCPDDVVTYQIYYSEPLDTSLSLLDITTFLSYQHNLQTTLAGCYAVSAVDSFANESALSNLVCVENCLEYELPNAFTPNGDQFNDVYVPRKSRFVTQVRFKVFNRWGEVIFETEDPAINWTGTNKSGQELPEGVYFYACEVFEETSEGVELLGKELSGYVHLIRGQ